MYSIFTYIWVIFMVNVGKYTIHGSYGHINCIYVYSILLVFYSVSRGRVARTLDLIFVILIWIISLFGSLVEIHPRKLTWIPRIAMFERRFFFETIIFGIYVRFRGRNFGKSCFIHDCGQLVIIPRPKLRAF